MLIQNLIRRAHMGRPANMARGTSAGWAEGEAGNGGGTMPPSRSFVELMSDLGL